ncbi:MAG: cystathionine gamma-synthase [Alphaproteobacteria bacterium]|nr:cystathionine gamma-synthase [Alphaproteobacteria bacterium]
MARKHDTDRKPSTLAAQAMGWLDPASNGVIPSIQPSTTYARDENYEKVAGYGYTRDENPTYVQCEALLAALEEGHEARLFASGMAAATTALLALSPGDHIVAPTVMYFGLRKWLLEVGAHWGLEVDFVRPGDIDAIAAAVRPGITKLVWIETPCNPTWEVTDIAAAADIAHGVGAKLAVDSTVATPVLTRPLTLGADLVMHSATKFLNGHSDVLAGVLVTPRDDDWWQRIHSLRHQNGAMLGPFEAWLLLRGMRTLYLRVARACESALAIANHFDGDRRLVEVLYPGLPAHPGHRVAAAQMNGGFGGVLSIRVEGGAEAALAVAKAVKLFAPATSLGGVESLIEHRATAEGPTSPVPPDLLRLSVGIEDADDLIADLEQALGA